MDTVVKFVNVKYIKDVWIKQLAIVNGLLWLALEKT